jgi:hypothetical protein
MKGGEKRDLLYFSDLVVIVGGAGPIQWPEKEQCWRISQDETNGGVVL